MFHNNNKNIKQQLKQHEQKLKQQQLTATSSIEKDHNEAILN